MLITTSVVQYFKLGAIQSYELLLSCSVEEIQFYLIKKKENAFFGGL